MKYLKILILYVLCFVSFYTKAQELPPLENFSPDIYEAENQNWDISQSNEKYIYVANNSGLLEFNGSKWRLYPSPNNTIIRSVNVVDHRIYTGCYMEFGYWENDEYGRLKYNSLLNKLTEPLIDDEQFWNIIKFDDWMLFQSLNRIYIFNTITEKFRVINSKTTLPKIFKVDGGIYFQKMYDGVYKIENGKEVLISNDAVLKNNTLVNIFSVDKKLLFQTQMSGFYFLENKQLQKWNISANKVISSLSIYSSIQLKDGSFLLGTISKGLYQLDKKGNIILNINQEKGLNNNTVLAVFEDYEHNIWLALDNGISVVNFNSPFKVYDDVNGKLGTVYASAIYNNYLYLGTNQGLYYKKLNGDSDFEIIHGTNGQVWCLKIYDKTLFCGHNLGTFTVVDDEAELITDVMGAWDIKPIKQKPNLLLQGNYNGLNVLQKVNGKWQFKNKIEGFDISSKFFEFAQDTTIFVSHEYKGVYKLNINSDFTKVKSYVTEKTAPKGFKSSLVSYNNNLLYTSKDGVFKYDNKLQKFQKDSILTNDLFDNDEYVSGKLIANNETNTLWGFTNKSVVYFSPGKLNNEPKADKISFPTSIRRDFAGYESIAHMYDKSFLLGSSRGYVILDLNKLESKSYAIKINSIEKSILNETKTLISLEKDTNFKFKENNLYFTYSVPEFNKYTQVNYQYRLEGIYNEWSNWSAKSDVSFKNLPYSDYVFEVRALIGNKLSENTASYSFKIERPWYLSNQFLLFYFLLFLVLLLVVHNLYKRYYNKQKQKLLEKKKRELTMSQLESDKVIMKLRNEKLQNEIESKTRELGVSTMNIIKKNELLTKIKDELTLVNDAKKIKPVINIINKNLNHTGDWEIFQEAFNNADSDFLKKVKKAHPTLTPNDLRLCAYLRLNLSSKEIAPLLNISARSVEIKRYRLRKKMELTHEKGLVEYILEI
ncbi:triple tyrosine motif-containing protein [Lutibacter sp. B1]|uniref:triple tyrosine motif-containing protein n=1 Tax=Lutibacter sp. B1 TaxID=2725996 RepID=UPI0014569CC2|nr:triple tyrosine motif-containing protein [Lutibacter sp. B1]NLP57096.1 hypothetical protein [Lutibacter sp. B1]